MNKGKQKRHMEKECKHIKKDSFIMLQSFMVTDLKLKGNDLLVYGIIYGYSHSNNGSFTGSLQYLADWTSSTKQAVMNSLKKLEELGLLEKEDWFENSVKRCKYKAVEDYSNILDSMQKSCIGSQNICIPMQKSCTNNIANTIEDNKENNILLLEKQTQDVLVSESLINNIDRNCTLPIKDSTKESLPQEKNYKYLQNKERFDFIREKTKYWNDNSPESARIKSGKKGEKGNDWCLKKLYDMVGKEKAEVVFDSVMSMPNRKPFYLVSSDILQQTLATYQDPNQETPKYLSNSLYERQSRYKGGDIPDDKMISSEATFYASLEWHFSDRYEGAELVKKVREFIKENNCKYKNY